MSREDRDDLVGLYLARHPDAYARLVPQATTAPPPKPAQPGGRAKQVSDLPPAQQEAMRARFLQMWQKGDPKRGRVGSDPGAIAWLLDPDR